MQRHFGETYFAWRRVLDTDGTMNLQRPELFKVCRTLGWRGDMRLLWQALDADSAGSEIECSKGKMHGIAFCQCTDLEKESGESHFVRDK